jgi:hypothetical protein
MRKIYMLLLPNYKKEEMEKEILSEWNFDCGGRNDLDYNLLVLILFRVVHFWAVHVDYEEYAFLLTKIYERITCKVIVKSKTRQKVLPKIVVSFPEEEAKLQKSAPSDPENEGEDNGAEWVECDEEESPRSDYEYKYGDENDTMDLKRYKRPKNAGNNGIMVTSHIKEPFLYKESVVYDFDDVEEGATIVDQLIKEEHVLPIGYPTEQYLFKIKNDVYEVLNKFKDQNKGMDDDLKDFNDPGDLKVANEHVSQTFFLYSNNGYYKEYDFCANILDSLYNNFRRALRECVSCTLRLFPEYSNINVRGAAGHAHAEPDRPVTEISIVGYNP